MTTAAAAMRPTGKPTPSGRLRTVSDQTRMVYFFGRTRTDGDAVGLRLAVEVDRG